MTNTIYVFISIGLICLAVIILSAVLYFTNPEIFETKENNMTKEDGIKIKMKLEDKLEGFNFKYADEPYIRHLQITLDKQHFNDNIHILFGVLETLTGVQVEESNTHYFLDINVSVGIESYEYFISSFLVGLEEKGNQNKLVIDEQ